MAKIGVERHGTLLQAVLTVLAEEDMGLPAKEVLARVEQRVVLTEHEAGVYPTNPAIRRFEKIVRFSTIGAVKAGWLVKSKGHWTITDDGRAALQQFTNPGDLIREASRLYRKWRKAQPDTLDQVDDADDQAAASTVLEEAEEQSWAEISEYLSDINPYEFQDLIEALVEGMGYYVLWKAPSGPDGGIDLIAHGDPLGTTSPRIKVQVKRRSDRIDAAELRSFMALLGRDDVGLFVATGGFTKDAEREARAQETRKVTLLDQKRLFDLWVEHYDRIPEERRRYLPLTKVYFLTPASD